MRIRTAGLRWVVAGLGLILAAACNDDSTGPEEIEVKGQTTVFATDSVYFSVAGDAVTQVSTSSTASWDFGFRQTAVFLRQTGTPVLALCLCQNASATNEQIVAMTPDSEKSDFDAVTAVQIPPATDARWSSTTTFTTNPWYKYNLINTNYIHPTFQVYLIKAGTTVYKLQIINYYDAAAASRNITFRYERLTT